MGFLATPLASITAALGGLFGPAQPVSAPVAKSNCIIHCAKPAPPPAPPKVSSPIAKAAGPQVKGTMILVHGGGWVGPNAAGQELLVDFPGQFLVDRGWRIVSVDYEQGENGMQNVLDAIGAEMVSPAGGLLCLYGESAGAQLALVAAARLTGVDCVIGAGAPTDFAKFRDEAAASGNDVMQKVYDKLIQPTFGEPGPATKAWEPAKLASRTNADVMLLRQQDDGAVPAGQADDYKAALPTTQIVDLPPGDPTDQSQMWLHGTISPAGRDQMLHAIALFTDLEVARRQAARAALKTGCARATQSLSRTGLATLRSSLGCLAHSRQFSVARSARHRRGTLARLRIRGQVTAARVWAGLRGTREGRAALASLDARTARVSVKLGDPSYVTISR